jgi:DNA-binding NtrC family response regulator
MKLFKKPSERKLKIYTVDDEEYYMNLVKVNLEKLGYNDIKTFLTGEECLVEIVKEKPDCVILDYLIKEGMNGDEILKRLKLNYPDIDVIILSGQEDVEIATNIIRQGATDYVVKNKMSFFNIGNTLRKINQLVNSEEVSKWKTRRIKLLLVLLIIAVWIIGGILLYVKIKNGIIF